MVSDLIIWEITPNVKLMTTEEKCLISGEHSHFFSFFFRSKIHHFAIEISMGVFFGAIRFAIGSSTEVFFTALPAGYSRRYCLSNLPETDKKVRRPQMHPPDLALNPPSL